ncbi:MAG: hypothetical protein ACXADL_13975 [Candidatus Thorarchaeota archaeon]|jgi:hypothetical protein
MPKKKDPRKVGPVYRLLAQDLYATGFHGDEVGFMQDEVWRSKSRQFTRDADIMGKIDEAKRPMDSNKLSPKEKVGFIIRRESLWAREKDKLARRLVVKLFSKSGGWICSMEEMIAEEYAMSFSSDEPLVAFTVISKGIEIVTWIKQVRRGKLSTENYTFYILGPDRTFETFRIEGKRGTLGDDFRVVRVEGEQTIAEIDSKFGDVGGEFIVSVKDPTLADNEWFCRILQCFSIMILFRIEIRKKIAKGIKEWKKGKVHPSIHRYEASLLANPRKLTLSMDEFEEI